MNIVIVGDGKVGVALTEQLSKEGHDLVVIDSNRKVLEASLESYDVMVVTGNGAVMKVQQQAGVPDCDLLIAATSADEINLLTCIVGRKLGARHTIARVRNPEYAEQLVQMREELGLSMTINPELAAAAETYHLLQFPSFMKRESFAKGKVEIVEIRIGADSKLCGIPLFKLYEIAKVRVLVCAVERGDNVYIPDGSFTLLAGDKIYVTAGARYLAALIRNLGIQTQKIRSVLIVGGSRIGFYLTRMLTDSGISVKLIEQRHERCLHLAEQLPKAIVMEADGSRQDVLLAEGIEEVDAVVTLTNIDEENLIISMYANHIGVPKVVTKINRTEYIDVFKDSGIDSVISPKALCSTDIVRYVRAMENTIGGAVITMHNIGDGKAEALEFRANSATRHLGESLTSIPLKKNFLIACISRRGRTIIPKGDDYFLAGDTVIVVTTSELAIIDLNDMFDD